MNDTSITQMKEQTIANGLGRLQCSPCLFSVIFCILFTDSTSHISVNSAPSSLAPRDYKGGFPLSFLLCHCLPGFQFLSSAVFKRPEMAPGESSGAGEAPTSLVAWPPSCLFNIVKQMVLHFMFLSWLTFVLTKNVLFCNRSRKGKHLFLPCTSGFLAVVS